MVLKLLHSETVYSTTGRSTLPTGAKKDQIHIPTLSHTMQTHHAPNRQVLLMVTSEDESDEESSSGGTAAAGAAA